MIQSQSTRAAAPASDGLASWYTPGLVDGFGDRLLMFDNTETDSLELLRFSPSLTAVAGFEDALHERVRLVGRIPDHAFPLIVAVERLDGDGALALVSTHVPGKRLSSFFDRPGRRGLNPAFVTGIVTQAAQALAVLQAKGDDITHSAVTAERIIVTTGGRITVIEHVLGGALRCLNLPALQLWREFGLVSLPSASGAARLDARTDVYQLGVLALEMLLGRRLTPLDLKDRLPDLLDQWSEAIARAGFGGDRLRYWLERALQLRTTSYGTAADAYADLREVPSESPASAFEALTGDFEAPLKRSSLPPAKAAVPAVHAAAAPPYMEAHPAPAPARPALVAPDSRRGDAPTERAPRHEPPAAESTPAPAAAALASMPPPPRSTAPARPGAGRRMTFRAPRVSPWVAAALGAVALVEGGVIVALLVREPPPAPARASAPLSGSPVPAAAPPVQQPASAAATAPAAQQPPAAPAPGPDVARLAAAQRSGGVRLVAPIALNVLQGERVLGSTADGPIILTAGTHQLDVINTALGFRMRLPVTFRAGQITSLNVTIPPGRVSVNAQPWAEVLIDNRPVGETPLANLSVPLGEHEVVFRHPELGERRQTITVRGDGPTRVSTTFDR